MPEAITLQSVFDHAMLASNSDIPSLVVKATYIEQWPKSHWYDNNMSVIYATGRLGLTSGTSPQLVGSLTAWRNKTKTPVAPGGFTDEAHMDVFADTDGPIRIGVAVTASGQVTIEKLLANGNTVGGSTHTLNASFINEIFVEVHPDGVRTLAFTLL